MIGIHDEKRLLATGLTAALLVGLYVALYEINVLLIGDTAFGGIASLLFLPAFIRLLAVLLLGWRSAPILFVAAWICVDLELSTASQLIVASALAVGAPIGIQIAKQLSGLNVTLNNLTGKRLLFLSFAAAIGNSAAYHLGLAAVGISSRIDILVPVTILGDTIGTWIVIYGLKATLMCAGKLLPKR